MSAQDNLSHELFFNAHRGIKLYSPQEKVDTSALGMHWSASADKAEEFATKHMHWPDKRGVRYEAQVPLSAVETNTKTLGQRGFAGETTLGGGAYTVKDPLNEQEVPVKEGAKVKVSARTSYRRLRDGQMKTRTRRYKPPREMSA